MKDKTYTKTRYTTKKQVMDFVEKTKELIEDYSKTDHSNTSAYYNVLFDMFGTFIDKLKKIDWLEVNKLGKQWEYNVLFLQQSFVLELCCRKKVEYETGKYAETVTTSIIVLKVTCKMLTVEEYANLHNVKESTVRSWIRRGKIRNAEKNGNEWRIPELVQKPSRGFNIGSYHWNQKLTDVPKDFSYLEDYLSLSIIRDHDDNKYYNVHLFKKSDYLDSGLVLHLTKNELERLEVFLISHKDVQFEEGLNDAFKDAIGYLFTNSKK